MSENISENISENMSDKEMISREKAEKEVDLAGRRIAMLHLAYARTLVEKLGEEEGRKMILASIKRYGKMVGEKTKEAVLKEGWELEPENFGRGPSRTLPEFGICDSSEILSVEDGRKRSQVCGCTMGKVWREMEGEELGSLYCYVDAAKYMYYNPDYKMIHHQSMPRSGGDCCLFEVKETTEREKELFFAEEADWIELDNDDSQATG